MFKAYRDLKIRVGVFDKGGVAPNRKRLGNRINFEIHDNNMLKQDLISRWENETNWKIAFEKIASLFRDGGKLRPEYIPDGLINDKIDVRGINASNRKVTRCEFFNVDFSFSSFNNVWIERSFFDNCIFDKVDFSNFSDHQNQFKDCSFVNCQFNSAAIGYEGTKFFNCTFARCKFQRTIFARPEFVEVGFKNCRIKNIDFNASSFEACSFAGELKDVWFRGGFPLLSMNEYFGVPKRNEMKNVSFEDAELADLTFSNCCDLSTVKIKHDECYYKYNRWKERLQFLKAVIDTWGSEEKKVVGLFVEVNMVHALDQHWSILSKHDLERDYGNEISFKILSKLGEFS